MLILTVVVFPRYVEKELREEISYRREHLYPKEGVIVVSGQTCYIIGEKQLERSGEVGRDNVHWTDYRTRSKMVVSSYSLVHYKEGEISAAGQTLNVTLSSCQKAFAALEGLEAELKFLQEKNQKINSLWRKK